MVEFTDGTYGTHDCTDLVNERGELNMALRERSYFAKVELENGVPTWPNFFDISPEWLQTEMINRGELHAPMRKKQAIKA